MRGTSHLDEIGLFCVKKFFTLERYNYISFIDRSRVFNFCVRGTSHLDEIDFSYAYTEEFAYFLDDLI